MSGDVTISAETADLAEYLASTSVAELPAEVVRKTAMHVLDTLAAIVSGATMPAGLAGQRYRQAHASSGPALVIGTPHRMDVQGAALVNGMAAHADETDDSHAPSLSHPGCAVVPAVLALASVSSQRGSAVLRAVAAGYDVGTRIGMALGHPESPLEGSSISTHAHVGCYAAAAAGASLRGFSEEQCRAVLSFAAQSAAGTTTWARDPHHVEKAFVFGGMPSSNGVRAVQLVEVGCLGVADPFSGQPNALDAVSPRVQRSHLHDRLGQRFEISRAAIKKFAVGSPSQAPVQAALDILAEHTLHPADIADVMIEMPHDLAPVVNAREMPNINVQYLVSGTLIDRQFSFAMAHDDARLRSASMTAFMRRVRLVPDPTVTARRQATVTVTLHDGTVHSAFVPAVRGTPDDPMREDEICDKAIDLIAPVLGDRVAHSIAETVMGLEQQETLQPLFELLSP